jgi:hypothetical protein
MGAVLGMDDHDSKKTVVVLGKESSNGVADARTSPPTCRDDEYDKYNTNTK